jgi:hypothetical protein
MDCDARGPGTALALSGWQKPERKMKRSFQIDTILAGLMPIAISGRPAGKQMWVAPELLERLRPLPLRLEMPRPIPLQVDDQIEFPRKTRRK